MATSASDEPEVETTNWNAVKLLATKYGIHLRSYEEEHAAHGQAHGTTAKDGEGELIDEDLGYGTPFRITAKRLEGGRMIYRFKVRGPEELRQLQHQQQRSQGGAHGQDRSEGDHVEFSIPRSESDSATLGSKGHHGSSSVSGSAGGAASRLAQLNPLGLRRHAASGSGSGGGGAHGFGPAQGKTLRATRSIPTLRGFAAAQSFIRGVGAGGSHHAAPASGSNGASESGNADTSSPSSLTSPVDLGLGIPAAAVTATATSMARAESQPVRGPLARLGGSGGWGKGGAAGDELQGGDVLGAILKFRDASDFDAADAPPGRVSFSGTRASSSSTRHDAAGRANAHAALGEGIARSVSPFGQTILQRPSQDTSASSGGASRGAAVGATQFSGDGWKRSPIPEVAGLGQPLSFDPGMFRASSPGAPSPAVGGTSPNIRALREMQSFESSASNGTARGGNAPGATSTPALRSIDPAFSKATSAGAEAGADSSTFIFDVLQYYRWDEASFPSTPSSKRSSAVPSLISEEGYNPQVGSPASVHFGTPESSGTGHRRANSDALALHRGAARSQESQIAGGDAVSSAGQLNSAAPGDDPRFCLWAVESAAHDGALMLTGRSGQTVPVSPTVQTTPEHGPSVPSTPSTPASASGVAVPSIAVGGKRWSLRGSGSGDGHGSGHGGKSGRTASTSSTSSSSQRNSVGVNGGAAAGVGDAGTSSGAANIENRPMLIAATPARLVAELTSEIDNRLLTDFFYTYRTLLEPSQLLSLLISRFQWALLEPVNALDEGRRRIVRVRTYVVLKYWLLHFFETDFLPSRALRRQLTDWLNELGNDPRLPSRPADMSIVKSLKKIVRNLKSSYEQAGMGGLLLNEAGRLAGGARPVSPEKARGAEPFGSSAGKTQGAKTGTLSRSAGLDLGASNAPGGRSPRMQENVDLDLGDQVGEAAQDGAGATTPNPSTPGAAHSKGREGAVMQSPPGSLGNALASQSPFLERGLDRRLFNRSTPQAPGLLRFGVDDPSAHGGAGAHGSPSVQAPPPPLPTTHGALSRAFVNTVGRLSRFKRVLGSRGAIPGPFPGGVDVGHLEGLEFEANDSGDLLFIRGGLENFISFFNLPKPASQQGMEGDGVAAIQGGEGAMPSSEDEGDSSQDLPSDGTTTAQNETPSLVTTSAHTRSTPASSLDLSRDGKGDDSESVAEAEGGAELGLGIGLGGADFGADELIGRLALDAANLRSFDEEQQRKEQLQNAVSAASVYAAAIQQRADHLHHTTSEQTLRSVSLATTAEQRELGAGAAKAQAAGLEPPALVQRSTSRSSSFISNRFSARSARSNYELRRSGSGGRPNIVQIDDIDLSSDEDDGVVRRALRRLPGARDLRMANHIHDLEPIRQSFDSVSQASFGGVHAARSSIGSHFNGSALARPESRRTFSGSWRGLPSGAAPQENVIGHLQTELFDPDEALAGYELVRGFKLDGIESDEEDEPGDVEAALRRLEGVIDEEKQREKARRVERMFKDSIARKAEQEGGAAQGTKEGEGEEHIDAASRASHAAPSVIAESAAEVASVAPSAIEARSEADASMARSEPLAAAAAAQAPAPPSIVAPSPKKKTELLQVPGVRPAQPSGLGAGWAARRHTAAHHQHQAAQGARLPSASKFGLWTLPPVHRSFLLSYKSDVIAQQLCLIEAELFKAITWEELVGGAWNANAGEVLDWEAFYQGRVRARAEAQKRGEAYHESAIEAIIARFNLTSNWVASEIVLTQSLDERAAVVCKFIRVAFRSYQQSNFATLTQIMLGLQSPWVERLSRTWSKVGMYEMRMLRDLKNFTSPVRNFSHLRNALKAMKVDSATEDLVTGVGPGAQGWNGGSAPMPRKAKDGTSVTDGCVPFFGLFLSDLAFNESLPRLIDQSSPSSPAVVDEDGSLVPSNPSAFDHLPPLPAGVRLEPLANIYKLRQLAQIVKTVLAFQNKARAYTYEADAGAYLKCLRIRCLAGEQMTQISHIAEP